MIFNLLFGCRHKHVTRPITPLHRPGAKAGLAYVVCLDCTKQFQYDVTNMRMGKPIVEVATPSNSSLLQTTS